ncbi:MAG: DNA methyltransferase [Candidatus Methanoperedens sp.]|nr:DNA methyltransferase [Candidatus Methanoperedens sp.]
MGDLLSEATIEYVTSVKTWQFQQTIASPDELINLFNIKEIDKEWSFEDFKKSETGKWTHDYHRYPAKFIPQLVEKLIDEYIFYKDAYINDPFMGCGTTMVTAISRGFKASGTDINKVAHLITKVKSTPINPEYLDRKIRQLLSKLKFLDENQKAPFDERIWPLVPRKHIDRINYWFTEKNKNELGKILRVIYDEEDETIRDFFLVAFSHILKRCSIWLQGSTKPTRTKPTKNLKKKPVKPYEAFRNHLKKMQRGNDIFYDEVPANIKENLTKYLNIKVGDARKQPVSENSIDLIVSSSPFVTSYEYADLHQLSTIWLEFADDLKEYRGEFIGTSYKKYEHKRLKSKIGKDIVVKMTKKSKKMAKEIEAFFIDMQEVFDESFRILKHGSRCCYVIGDTKLRGIDILNAEVFAESLQQSGFKLDKIIKREIPLKILPQKRDEKTGKFANNHDANSEAYPIEYIVIGLKG